MKILLPDTIPLAPTLPDGWEAVTVDARAEIPSEHRDADVLVLWAPSRAHLSSAVETLHQLKFVQSLSAGIDGIVAAGFRQEVVIAAGAGLHSLTVSEHALALLLNLVRRLPEAAQAQARHEWSTELGGPQPLHPEGRVTTLIGAKVLIWGFGQIGQNLAPTLKALGADVRGAARSAGTRAGFEVIADTDVLAALPEVDILIDILPASEQTTEIVGREALAALPDHAILINVGRGSTVDQVALREALEAGTLGSAGIDVTEPEPLPAADPLWDAPRLLITPHGAGGRPVGADERISENLRALVEGTEIPHAAAR